MLICVNAGPMFAGKSSMIYDIVHQSDDYNVMVFKPAADTRDEGNVIITHNGRRIECFPVVDLWGIADNIMSISKVLDSLQHHARLVVAVDEFQFFNEDAIYTLRNYLEKIDFDLHIFGLDQYSDGKPWPTMENAKEVAHYYKLHKAVCAKCGSANGTRTQKLRSTGYSTEIGGKDLYEPRCDNCWEPRT